MQDVNYIQQNTTPTTNTLESDCTPSLTHATRVSPATVSFFIQRKRENLVIWLVILFYEHVKRSYNENGNLINFYCLFVTF